MNPKVGMIIIDKKLGGRIREIVRLDIAYIYYVVVGDIDKTVYGWAKRDFKIYLESGYCTIIDFEALILED